MAILRCNFLIVMVWPILDKVNRISSLFRSNPLDAMACMTLSGCSCDHSLRRGKSIPSLVDATVWSFNDEVYARPFLSEVKELEAESSTEV